MHHGSPRLLQRHQLALPAGYTLEGYRLERVLGQGGYGITYLGTDVQSGRKVAIKELLPHGLVTRVQGSQVVPIASFSERNFERAQESFVKEARTLAGLSHPNVVQMHRLFMANGTAYMVMDYVEGQSMREWLRKHPQPSEAQLRNILMPLLDGLEHVHEAGLLHRDIKPDNIFITTKGKPVLLDFGSARADLGRTQTLTAIVSEGYSPFEQYQKKARQNAATDLYSLAASMVRAITGDVPASAIDRSANPTFQRPVAASHKDRYRVPFLKAVDAAFSVQASDRPQSVAEWRAMFDEEGPAKKPGNAPAKLPAPAPALPQLNSRLRPLIQPSRRLERWMIRMTVVMLLLSAVGGGYLLVRLWVGGSGASKTEKAPQVPAQAPSSAAAALAAPVAAPGAGVTPAGPEPSAGDLREATLPGGVLMKFRYCPAGTFTMGSSIREAERGRDEVLKEVTISRGFWMAQTEVTQEQWEAVMGHNPSFFTGDKHLPVEQVSWEQAQAFVWKLNQLAQAGSPELHQKGCQYALPDEAQWEYACRAGTRTAFHVGDALTSIEANFDGSRPYGTFVKGPYLGRTVVVGSYLANAWGLLDMHGNVREWCAGWDGKNVPGGIDSPGHEIGGSRVLRGGSWYFEAALCRSAVRNVASPDHRSYDAGFRPALVPVPVPE